MAEKYKVEDLPDSDDDVDPAQENLFAAASYIRDLLTKANLPFAFLGGFSLRCRGHSRITRDVDAVVEASMRQLWAVLEGEERLKIPKNRAIEAVCTVFVKTGSAQGDGNLANIEIRVDMVIAGTMRTPQHIQGNSEDLSVHVDGKLQTFPALNIQCMMRTKLSTFHTRELAKDESDILYLLRYYATEVRVIAEDLELGDREFFVETLDDGGDVDENELARIRQTLRLQEREED